MSLVHWDLMLKASYLLELLGRYFLYLVNWMLSEELWIIQTLQRTKCVVVDISGWLMFQMITKNFEDYPEHRLKFFSLLRAIATHCFPALIRLSSEVCVNICPLIESCLNFYIADIWHGWNLVCSDVYGWLLNISYCIHSFNELFLFHIYLLLFVIHTATKASYGFYHLGFPAHWEEHIWNGAQSFVGDAEKLSGVICHGFFVLFCCFAFISMNGFDRLYGYLAGFWVL